MKALPFTRFLSLALTILAGAAGAAEYEPGSGWQEFTFTGTDGSSRFPNREGPFTFSVTAEQQPRLVVTDVGTYGAERFDVYNFGAFTGNQTFWTNEGFFSSGSWPLPPGDYSLTFGLSLWAVQTPLPISGNFKVEIYLGPQQLRTSPQYQASCIGGTASFRVQALGQEPFAYQWYFNGTNLLAGETNTRLNLINLTTNLAGQYSATVSNVYGGTVSPAATLQVFDACVGLNLYAGLSITGLVGRTYTLDYVTNLAETNWTALATNTLTQPSWLFIDTNTPYEPKKFFRVRLQP